MYIATLACFLTMKICRIASEYMGSKLRIAMEVSCVNNGTGSRMITIPSEPTRVRVDTGHRLFSVTIVLMELLFETSMRLNLSHRLPY